jgi:SAM-dependent methyltransferase
MGVPVRAVRAPGQRAGARTRWASARTTRYLDVACGSGYAAAIAHRRGATVSGLDASEDLIDIARARTPDGDFRVGDMFALPFAEGAFDVVTSFNGIWNGCDDALDQARTVLTDTGLLGLTYWGAHERMGLMPYFITVIEHSPPSHQAATMELGETSNVIAGHAPESDGASNCSTREPSR